MANNIYLKEFRKNTNILRKARIEAGFTQEQVAEKLGKPQSYFSKSEAGERHFDITELKKFAELYKKDINQFLK